MARYGYGYSSSGQKSFDMKLTEMLVKTWDSNLKRSLDTMVPVQFELADLEIRTIQTWTLEKNHFFLHKVQRSGNWQINCTIGRNRLDSKLMGTTELKANGFVATTNNALSSSYTQRSTNRAKKWPPSVHLKKNLRTEIDSSFFNRQQICFLLQNLIDWGKQVLRVKIRQQDGSRVKGKNASKETFHFPVPWV